MPKIGLRRAAALLVAVVLLLAAVPAAAAPERHAAEPSAGSTVFETLTSWLAGLWTGVTSTSPEPVWEALGSGADAEGAPQAANDDPTADPQLGSGADPNG